MFAKLTSTLDSFLLLLHHAGRCVWAAIGCGGAVVSSWARGGTRGRMSPTNTKTQTSDDERTEREHQYTQSMHVHHVRRSPASADLNGIRVSAQATSRLALFGCAWGSHGWKGAIGERVGTAPELHGLFVLCATPPPLLRASSERLGSVGPCRHHQQLIYYAGRAHSQPHTSFQPAISRLLGALCRLLACFVCLSPIS